MLIRVHPHIVGCSDELGIVTMQGEVPMVKNHRGPLLVNRELSLLGDALPYSSTGVLHCMIPWYKLQVQALSRVLSTCPSTSVPGRLQVYLSTCTR
jgi:hypothetical protein